MRNGYQKNKYFHDKPKSDYANNPYNFVPLSDQVFQRYGRLEELPAHNALAEDRISGVIHCSILAETPICISDGNGSFYRNPGGAYVIPGSSLKGLVRTNMQVLGFGAIRAKEDFDDLRLMYRLVGQGKSSVHGKAKAQYQRQMGIPEDWRDGSWPEKIRAGYLIRDSAGRYMIHPTSFLRVHRKRDCALPWKNVYRREEPVFYQENGRGSVTGLQRDRTGQPPGGWKRGILLCPGMAPGKKDRETKEPLKPNGMYLFPEYRPQRIPVSLTEEDILLYKTDYELRENALKGFKNEEYWKIPEEAGRPWPVFYLQTKEGCYFGRSPMIRIGYAHSLGEGLEKPHRDAAETLTLDYPYAMLGFTYEGKGQKAAYRSRVSFGDFAADHQPDPPIKSLLMEPKVSSFADYATGDYNQKDFHLRGVKQYWLKEHEVQKLNEKQENLADDLALMPRGTHFRGQIHFKNLSRDELGLLLWCLRLEEGCFQTIGHGKPLGYGRASITIHSVERYKPGALYSAALLEEETPLTEPVDPEMMIRTYKDYIETNHLGNAAVASAPSVRDFLYIHTVIREAEEVCYMSIEKREYQNRKKYLPTIAVQRETLEQSIQEK